MILSSIFRSIYEKQIDAVFLWLSSVATENDRILVDLPGKSGMYRFKFPLTVGDYPRLIIPKPLEPATFAIVRSEKILEEKEQWVSIFSSQEFNVYERRTRFVVPPLRWGMDLVEKSALLKIARKNLEACFYDGENREQDLSSELRDKFDERLDVDVALWVRGKLRGSMISTNKTVLEGVIEAARRAVRDLRFKPVTETDLKEIRIEITVFSPLRIPLTAQLITERRILPEKGYCLMYGEKIGWLLPEVFNVRQFRDLSEMLEMLARKKVGLSVVDNNIIQHTIIFEVQDFIEPSRPGKQVIDLRASMADASLSPQCNYLERAHEAALWLCSIQEEDGNIPAIVDFSKITHKEKVDWSRLGFAALALHELWSVTGEDRFYLAAERVLGYFESVFLPQSNIHKFPVSPNHISVYAGQLAMKLGRPQIAYWVAEELVLHNISKTPFNPIFYSQWVKLLGELSGPQNQLVRDKFIDAVRSRFLNEDKEKPLYDLASWASAAEVFWNIDRKLALEIAAWISRYQNSDGSFPTSPTNPKPYTRGTGKIAEILALNPDWNGKTEKALSWLCSMQYHADITFFMPPESRLQVLGSLRHDYLNWESWTDSVAHFILATTRFLQSKD